jgi:hypothetical protein
VIQQTITNEKTGSEYVLTKHAGIRMKQRGLSHSSVQMALVYGRVVHARGALIHVIGRKEIVRHNSKRENLSALDGVHVVCDGEHRVLTAYKNRNLRRLRPRRRSHG